MVGVDLIHLLIVNGMAELWEDDIWLGQEITMQSISPTSFSLSVHIKHNIGPFQGVKNNDKENHKK